MSTKRLTITMWENNQLLFFSNKIWYLVKVKQQQTANYILRNSVCQVPQKLRLCGGVARCEQISSF